MAKEFENGEDSLPKDCLARLEVSTEYVIHSAINNASESKLAVSTSTFEISLYDIQSQAKVLCYKGHDASVTGIKFSEQDPNLLYSSSLDGTILLWDLRKGILPVKTYADDTNNSAKAYTCFDYNCSELYLCAGTEVISEDSFLIFWDKRMTKPVGGYWNCQYDEITQVQFHQTIDSHLASSSMDGLINIFDLSESTEDDALQDTLKTESSVYRFCMGSLDTLSCITKDDEYQFWSTTEVKPSVLLSKKQISEEFLCDVNYLIDTFRVNDVLYLGAGTNDGFLQLYSCNKNGLKIIKEFRNGHYGIIRTLCHCKKKNVFITGGEDGLVCIWRSSL